MRLGAQGYPKRGLEEAREGPQKKPKWADASGVLHFAAVFAQVGPFLQHVSSLLRSKANHHLILCVWLPKGTPREAWKRQGKVQKRGQNGQILVVFCRLQLCWQKLALSCGQDDGSRRKTAQDRPKTGPRQGKTGPRRGPEQAQK